MLLKTNACKGCPNFTPSTGFTAPLGRGVSNVLIVGEAPSVTDIHQETASSPYSERGSVLRRALSLAGLDIDHFTYTNLLQCAGKPCALSLQQCAGAHLRPLVERLQPRCIVALGDKVIESLAGLVGPKCTTRYVRGFVVPGRGAALGTNVLCTFDPQFLREGNMHLLGCLAEDLKRSLTVVRDKAKYAVWGLGQLDEWIRRFDTNPDLPLAVDIETPYSTKANDEEEIRDEMGNITQIQFSISPDLAIVLPWTEKVKQATKYIIGSAQRLLTWNGYTFDQPRLEAEGVEFRGIHHDLMCAWHFYQPDLPMNLSFATGSLLGTIIPPWKHTMGEDLVRYGALDVITLQHLWPTINAALVAESLDTGYSTFIVDFQTVLRDMSRRGVPIDVAYRQEFRSWVRSARAELDVRIQAHVPDSLKDAHPKCGYKGRGGIPQGKLFRKNDEGGVDRYDPKLSIWEPLTLRDFDGEQRWCRVKPFLASSTQQVQRYAQHHGHKIPKIKTGDEWHEGTGKKELLKTAATTGDAFYRMVIDLRELGKIDSTYIDSEGWQPSSDGKIHAEFHNGPASGQIGSRRPNVQNIPKPGKPGTLQHELATRIRRCIVASPGHKIVAVDMSGFHAQTLAWCAQDRDYARLAALDPHSFLAAHMLRIEGVDNWMELTDSELSDRLAWVKRNHEDVRNKQAKPAILGIGFGMGASKLYRLNEDSFSSLAEARKVRSVLQSLFPRIFVWQADTKKIAHTTGKLTTPFGCVRRFWDVMSWDEDRGEWRPGTQAEECIAYQPSNTAHCHIKLAGMRMQANGWLDRYRLINFIHDEYLFDCPNELVDECVENVKMEMERPSTVMVGGIVKPEGFWVQAEASVGADWSSMRKVA